MCVTFPASLVRGWDSLKGATMVMAASAVVAGLKERALASARGGRAGRMLGPGDPGLGGPAGSGGLTVPQHGTSRRKRSARTRTSS